MKLRIFNTLTGKKEAFEPLQADRVGMYVCGVTVYDYCHLGHARSAVVFDVIYRYLQFLGLEVCFVKNFTDIDDKIIKRANENGIEWSEVTRQFIEAYYEDMGRLNIAQPTLEPRATDHIHDMIEMIATLIEKGHAYESEGDVFYSVRSFETYGALSGRRIEDLLSGARVDVNEAKRDPLDFALWKKSKPGEPFWESPWSSGRPGWHIECSAMGSRLLGQSFDIHGGGKDLVFPHHENEIAQSCGASGCAPARYWIHNGFVNIDKEKMSKSLGNFFTIREIFKKFHPETVRLFLVSSHYRGPIEFSEQNLQEAEKVITRFYEALDSARQAEERMDAGLLEGLQEAIDAHPLLQGYREAMDDDFNSAVAVAHLNEALRALNQSLQSLSKDPAQARAVVVTAGALKKTGQLLGLFHTPVEEFNEWAFARKSDGLNLDVAAIETLIAERNAARASKDWAAADRCRDALTAMGVSLEDGPEGTLWKLK
ncbi:MAG: cysteine--tRNA ligase [Candidatus Nitrohelix vancouverensis]|uniref:Cysteine--tRNA ligase n=1 Tax=Candidatus Nitrohelix vancouverensis TaxID=2705534 RepID=A0A7T0C247_9BACT|nr:MAG: cysteine--tRNA ligase [Candidatus Nitrohelix vancouverensis]